MKRKKVTLFLCTVNFDDAVGANDCAAGTADASILIYHFKVVVTFRIYMFGKCNALVRAACDADGTALALFRVND